MELFGFSVVRSKDIGVVVKNAKQLKEILISLQAEDLSRHDYIVKSGQGLSLYEEIVQKLENE